MTWSQLPFASICSFGNALCSPAHIGAFRSGRVHAAALAANAALVSHPRHGFAKVTIALSAEDADRLFERLRSEGVHLFYVKTPVEFGTLRSGLMTEIRTIQANRSINPMAPEFASTQIAVAQLIQAVQGKIAHVEIA